MTLYTLKRIVYGFFIFAPAFWCVGLSQAQEEEKDYSISLTKTAEKQDGRAIYEVDDGKVLAQEYIVQDGDHVWQLLRERGLLEKRNLPELLSVLKKMNKSLNNLDLIHPGQKIIIPLKIAPIDGGPTQEKTVQIAELKDLNFQNYTVQKDDSVIRVIKGMYRMSHKEMYNDYLDLVRKMNPFIEDLNSVYPGQSIRLPIYSPEVVRVPIKMPTSTELAGKSNKEKMDLKLNPVAHDLAEIFMEIGEEWIRSGEHFIPLKTGGQINLKAEVFPIINLRKGHRVIVDLNSKLPPKMATLIESSWDNYRVVHLTNDDLKSSLDKIFKACNYPKVLKSSSTLELGKDIIFRITGDWIITLPKTGKDDTFSSIVIILRDEDTPNTPLAIRKYLERSGVKIIDYPPGQDETLVETAGVEVMKTGGDPASLVTSILDLAGPAYSKDANIQLYPSQQADLKLIINANFSLKVNGSDAVIDLVGLAPEVVDLLKEQGFQTLSLANEKDPLKLVSRTCEFLGVQFRRGPHHFMGIKKDDERNIRLTLPGIIFSDVDGTSVLATPLELPDEINSFLSQRGFRVLVISFSESDV